MPTGIGTIGELDGLGRVGEMAAVKDAKRAIGASLLGIALVLALPIGSASAGKSGPQEGARHQNETYPRMTSGT